jgi:hypothetical protein
MHLASPTPASSRYDIASCCCSAGTVSPLDVALGATPFEERAVGRASAFRVTEGISLLTCSAEDLILFKAFADRPQDWIDIEGITLRQHRRLDEGLIWQELIPLLELKEDEQTGPRLHRLLERAES